MDLADQAYALTAYILVQNKLIDAKQAINAQTLPNVQMPNRNGFTPRFPERMPPRLHGSCRCRSSHARTKNRFAKGGNGSSRRMAGSVIVGARWSQDDAIGGRSHARKTLQFRKKRCNFQKARAGEFLYVCQWRIKHPRSLSVTDAAVLKRQCERSFP
jgi:hypothetical protein